MESGISAPFTLSRIQRATSAEGNGDNAMMNVTLWVTGAPVHWMWWNAFGFAVTALVALPVSRLAEPPRPEQIRAYTLAGTGMLRDEGRQSGYYAVLAVYFLVILTAVVGSAYLID